MWYFVIIYDLFYYEKFEIIFWKFGYILSFIEYILGWVKREIVLINMIYLVIY